MKRRQYSASTILDLDSIEVRLIPIADESQGSAQRSVEVLNLVAQLLRLASKRGQVKKSTEEVFDEAA
jgi:hypothetical protein